MGDVMSTKIDLEKMNLIIDINDTGIGPDFWPTRDGKALSDDEKKEVALLLFDKYLIPDAMLKKQIPNATPDELMSYLIGTISSTADEIIGAGE